MEKHSRTIVKTLTWRVIATLATIIGVYIYKRDVRGAIAVGLALNIIKSFLYYAHERIWNKIGFGRVTPPPPPEYSI